MTKGLGVRTPTDRLVHRLRLMADSGGVLTRDRVKTVIEAADRLEELEQEVHDRTATCRELAHQANEFRKKLGMEPETEVTQDEEH